MINGDIDLHTYRSIIIMYLSISCTFLQVLSRGILVRYIERASEPPIFVRQSLPEFARTCGTHPDLTIILLKKASRTILTMIPGRSYTHLFNATTIVKMKTLLSSPPLYNTMGPIQALGLLSISWALWKLLRHRVVPSSLDNIPGPASESFLTGVFSKLFDTDGWAYQKSLHKTCKLVVDLIVI